MDIVAIAGAVQGLDAARKLISGVFDATVDVAAKEKKLEVMQKLEDVQNSLFSLREELFKLQSENNQLRSTIDNFESWQAKADQYELFNTPGGAIVYKFNGQPEHFACPSCFNKKELHFLQDNRTNSGKYRCTGCKSEYPIKPIDNRKDKVNTRPGGGDNFWMAR